jgi:hypothetical protein
MWVDTIYLVPELFLKMLFPMSKIFPTTRCVGTNSLYLMTGDKCTLYAATLLIIDT